MKRLYTLLRPVTLGLLFVLFTSQKCKDEPSSAQSDITQEQMELFCKKWNFQATEENGTVRVYRPEGYELPPSRGRNSYEFKEDGTAYFYTFGPTDRPVTKEGTWKKGEEEKTVLLLLSEGSSQVLRIKELSAEKLSVSIILD